MLSDCPSVRVSVRPSGYPSGLHLFRMGGQGRKGSDQVKKKIRQGGHIVGPI